MSAKEEMAAIEAELKLNIARTRTLTGRQRELLTQMVNENLPSDLSCEGPQPPFKTYDIHLGSWDCPTSPTKKCVYTHDYDDCIYCHDPDERK